MEIPLDGRAGMVGKEIGGFLYIHSSVFALDKVTDLSWAVLSAHYNTGIHFNILKIKSRNISKSKTGRIHSLLYSPDFDTANEPILLASMGMRKKDEVRWYQPPYWIYHHKWMMVNNDYKGFDVAKSFKRSKAWVPKCRDFSRIGKQDVWFELLKKWRMKP